MKRVVCCLFAFSTLLACTRKEDTPGPSLVSAQAKKPLPADLVGPAGGHAADHVFEDEIGLVGFVRPDAVKRGQQAELTLWWRFAKTDAAKRGPKVFVHGLVPGGELRMAGRDHILLPPMVAADSLVPGDVLEDRFVVAVPQDYPADAMQLYVGLYEGRDRYEVTAGEHDDQQRVSLGTLAISDGAPAFPTVKAKKRTGAITIDGKLDEPDWQRAERIGPFISYRGRGKLQNNTHARLLWDDDALYVAFECDDNDIHTPYDKRDDPLYESEAVEIFIDADGDKDEYVELQAAPNDTHFDAAFKGGRRKNFDTSYNVNYTSKAVLDGTLNEHGDEDKGWISEWRIPIDELRDIPGPVAIGTEWKINLFRLDRIRRGDKVVKNEASAWSSPYSGDFHNLDRFGTLVFAP